MRTAEYRTYSAETGYQTEPVLFLTFDGRDAICERIDGSVVRIFAERLRFTDGSYTRAFNLTELANEQA